MEIEQRDAELDDKLGEGRKRKRDEKRGDSKKGLGGLPGWEKKSSEVKNSDRWKRKVVRWVDARNGMQGRKESVERIPLPENFDLGKEKKKKGAGDEQQWKAGEQFRNEQGSSLLRRAWYE